MSQLFSQIMALAMAAGVFVFYVFMAWLFIPELYQIAVSLADILQHYAADLKEQH
jgi:hypothetical protein